MKQTTVVALSALMALTAAMKTVDQLICMTMSKNKLADSWFLHNDNRYTLVVQTDMMMDAEQLAFIRTETRSKRQVSSVPSKYKWGDCRVNYVIKPGDFSPDEERMILAAMKEWERFSCIQFQKATAKNKNKVSIQSSGRGCYSSVGRVGGTQVMNLGKSAMGTCVQRYVILHELGHVIGRLHEHSRPDRDDYIRVNYYKIPPELHIQFHKYGRGQVVNDLSAPYDYHSVMHYGSNVIMPSTIQTPNMMYDDVIGLGEGLSFRDILTANLMYNCAHKLCPSLQRPCSSQYGQDSFPLKVNNTCTCMCPGNHDNDPVVVPCASLTTTNATTTTTTTPTTTATTTGKNSNFPSSRPSNGSDTMTCMDLSDQCAALVQRGECKMSMERMNVLCKKSCNFCKSQDMCMDYDPWCSMMAADGKCEDPTLKEVFMEEQCKKSCFVCLQLSPCQMEAKMSDSQEAGAGGVTAGNGARRCYSTAFRQSALPPSALPPSALLALLLLWTLY